MDRPAASSAVARLHVIKSHLRAGHSANPAQSPVAARMSSPLTSHVLDTSCGQPAQGLAISLYRLTGSEWTKIASLETNVDGRCPGLISRDQFTVDTYKLRFETEQYFSKRNLETFYPYAEIVFRVSRPDQHHHVPLILSPHGYSTYRGS